MTTISIPLNRAHAAIVWAKTQGFKSFEVQHMMPDNKYHFRFDEPAQATQFALKWM